MAAPTHGTPLFNESAAPSGALLPDAGGNAGGLVTVGESVFYSNAISKTHAREMMTVLRSDDGASSWPRGALIFPGPAAYSHMCVSSPVSVPMPRPLATSSHFQKAVCSSGELNDRPCFVLPQFKKDGGGEWV